MKTVIIEVATPATLQARMKAALKGVPQGNFVSFPTEEALWKTLTPKRWLIIKALTGAGSMGVRELARKVARDVKAVHTDIQALVNCGVLDKNAQGKVEFPYDAVHVDFVVKAA
jgi:predicted transcriptional regulator